MEVIGKESLSGDVVQQGQGLWESTKQQSGCKATTGAGSEKKQGRVALITEPISTGGTVPLMGKSLSQPHVQGTRGSQVETSQDQASHPAPSTCNFPSGDDLFDIPGIYPFPLMQRCFARQSLLSPGLRCKDL